MEFQNFQLPKTYLIGYTSIDLNNFVQYLRETDQFEFYEDFSKARMNGMSDGEIISSIYAKLCYNSLTAKKNKNITQVRSIADNIKATISSAHGSVFEHCQLNFILTNCSRIMTHELVRHRVGTAFSQQSGRYVRNNQLNMVGDPILSPAADLMEEAREYLEVWYKKIEKRMQLDKQKDFLIKKKITSALRRMMPNGQTTEIGFSVNLRSLRHIIEMRTSRHAEWEIRYVFNQVYQLVKHKFPLIFFDVLEREEDGLLEVLFENFKI